MTPMRQHKQTNSLQVHGVICDYDNELQQKKTFSQLTVELTGGAAGALEVDLISVVVKVLSKLGSTNIQVVVVENIEACNVITVQHCRYVAQETFLLLRRLNSALLVRNRQNWGCIMDQKLLVSTSSL